MVRSLLNGMNDPFVKAEAEQSLLDFTKFDGTEAFNTHGFQDSDNASNGRAGTAEVDQQKLERIAQTRKRQEKSDQLIEALQTGYRLAEAHRRRFIDYSEEDMDAVVSETLANIDGIAERHNLNSQETSELTALLIAYQQAGSIEEKAAFLDQIGELNPALMDDMSKNARQRAQARQTSDLSQEEVRTAENAVELDAEEYAKASSRSVDRVEVAGYAVAVREGLSASDNPFEAGFSPAPDFNAKALGIEIATAPDPSSTDEPRTVAPSLA